jgi:hypothetical protein
MNYSTVFDFKGISLPKWWVMILISNVTFDQFDSLKSCLKNHQAKIEVNCIKFKTSFSQLNARLISIIK